MSIHSTLEPEAVTETEAGLRAWLSSGACQSSAGAFVAWLDLATGLAAYEYPEITGYALTYLAGLASLSADVLGISTAAADWLVGRLADGNLAARDGWDEEAVYLFDLAIIATGLVMIGRRIQVERYVDEGLRLSRYLRDEVSAKTLSPLGRGGPASTRDSWSTRGLAHLGKVVQPLLLAHELGDEASRPAAERLVETVKELQDDDGRIATHPEHPVMLHPHLYAAEGLYIWGQAVGDEDALERARAAVAWAWEQQLEQGGLPRSEAGEGEQTDATAQAVRLSLALGLPSAAADRGLARLVGLVRGSGEGRGLVYRPGSAALHLNTWSTLFGAQAFALAVPGAAPLDWRELV